MLKYEFYKNEKVDSIVDLIERSSKLYGDSVAIKYKVKKNLHEKTYNDLLKDSICLAKYLLSEHPEAEHIALLGASSYEWIIGYLGTVFAGLVIVPLDKELSSDELSMMVKQADVDLLIYDNEYDDIAKQIVSCENQCMASFKMERVLSVQNSDIELPVPEPDKMSAIVFTSGTTGSSKGVILTQNNIASNVIQGLGAVNVTHDKDIIISVLPFNHVYEFTCTILGMIYKGVPICISSGLKYFQRELLEFKPTLMFVVPLIAEKLYEKIEKTVKKEGKEKSFHYALFVSGILKKLNIDITDKVFAKIKNSFGGHLRIIMCGGAPLKEDLIKKFAGIGINLFQGYGLTECSPLLTVNFDYYHRPNSVGKIVDGNIVKIVDGEIWAKGLSVSSGYYDNLEETEKSFENGWFKTGDLGYIDKDDFVYITGRKKNLIILDNGKNVSAEEIEDLLYGLHYISEALVYGENGKIVAEIYIDDSLQIEEEQVYTDIDKINRHLPAFKNIGKVKLRTVPFEKTTSKKIKRKDT